MSAVATAIVGGAVIGGVASNMAAGKQASAANKATDAQTAMYNNTVANEQPYMDMGSQALSTLGNLPGLYNALPVFGGSGWSPSSPMQSINNTNWQQYMSPAYNFQLQQGTQALQNSQAAQDGVLSGSALKGLINYNQNFAQTGFNNAANLYMSENQQQFNQNQTLFNNYQSQNQNVYNRLAGLAQLGQNAASNTGMTGAGMASGIANTITGAGNAQAAGMVGAGNAVSGAANNGAGYLMMNNLVNGGAGFNTAYQSAYSGFDNPANYG